MKKLIILIVFCVVFSSLTGAEKPGDFEKYWTRWRGPYATGVSPHGNPPVEWSETKNIKWKIEDPGKGHSTPIIYGDQLFITTAVEADKVGNPKKKGEGEGRSHGWMKPNKTDKVQKFVVLAINRQNGKINWQKTVREEWPEESSSHNLGSWASNSAVTDG